MSDYQTLLRERALPQAKYEIEERKKGSNVVYFEDGHCNY
jgi:hypothetical protein